MSFICFKTIKRNNKMGNGQKKNKKRCEQIFTFNKLPVEPNSCIEFKKKFLLNTFMHRSAMIFKKFQNKT